MDFFYTAFQLPYSKESSPGVIIAPEEIQIQFQRLVPFQ